MSTKRRVFLLTAPLFLAMAAGISAATFGGVRAQDDPCAGCPDPCCCCCPDCCDDCGDCCPAEQAAAAADQGGDCENCCTDCPESAAADPADCGGCNGQ